MRFSIAISAALAACSTTAEPKLSISDAGTVQDASPSFAPASPVLTPCPAGWQEVTTGDLTTCDPWPNTSPVELEPCPPGWRASTVGKVVMCDPWPASGAQGCDYFMAHFAGEPGCRRVGTPCPAGEWPEGLPSDQPVLYVRTGATTGGNGSRASPFRTIAEATSVATAGTIIALSKGRFSEEVRLGEGVTLWGTCVEETLVTCSNAGNLRATVIADGREGLVRNLLLSGYRPGVRVEAGRSIRLKDVVVSGTWIVGVWVAGGQLDGTDVVIRNTQGADDWGKALQVDSSGRAELTRVVIERTNNNVPAVLATDAETTLHLSDLAVRDSEHHGLQAQLGAQVTVDRGVLERNVNAGIYAVVGANVGLRDVVVRETDGEYGWGIFAYDAQVTLDRGVILQSRMVGISASEAAVLTLTDVAVLETRKDERGYGYGLEAISGARVEVTRGVFQRNGDGIVVSNATTSVTLQDVVVSESSGYGLVATTTGQVDVHRCLFANNQQVGILTSDTGTNVSLSDVVVRETSCGADGFGAGIHGQSGGFVEVNRSVIERSCFVGLGMFRTSMTVNDLVVRDTVNPVADVSGSGVHAMFGVTATINRAVIQRNRGLGIIVAADTTVTMTDVVVEHTEEHTCPGGPCSGIGVGAYDGSHVTLTRFVVSHSELCGLQLSKGYLINEHGLRVEAEEGGSIDLSQGEVNHNPIGVNVQTEGFDLNRLKDRVTWKSNDINLDTQDIVVPTFRAPSL